MSWSDETVFSRFIEIHQCQLGNTSPLVSGEWVTTNLPMKSTLKTDPQTTVHQPMIPPHPQPSKLTKLQQLQVTLPYIQGVSDCNKRVLGSDNIRVSFRPPNSLRNMLSHPKDPVPLGQKSNIVYRIPCVDCDKCYVGQTGRTFSQRVKEHQRAVKTFDANVSVLAEHVMHADHKIAWEEATVMDHHPLLSSRLVIESW